MILFYNKTSGKIVGTIDGRIHPPEHLKMWVGDREKIGRVVIQWKSTGKEITEIVEKPIWEDYVDKDGFTEAHQVGVKKTKVKSIEFKPKFNPDNIITDFESGKKRIYDYKVKLKKDEVVGFMLK